MIAAYSDAKDKQIMDLSIKKSKRDNFQRSKSEKIVLNVIFVLFLIYAITLIYPFVWVFVNSFRTKQDFFENPLAIPTHIIFMNYVTIFTRFNIFEMFLNSAIVSVGCTLVGVFSSSMSAYIVAKYKFPGRDLIYYVAITLMIIPTAGALSAQFRLMTDLRLVDTYFGMFIMAAGGFGFNFFMLYGYFKSISWSYAEAAMIDGASDFQVFMRIMLPQAKGALVALGIIAFIGSWNDYATPYLFLKSKPTLAVGIQRLSDDITYGANASDYPALFAAMIISTVPIVVLFSVFQKTIIECSVAGGLKG